MDEYQLEIQTLRRKLERLRAEEADPTIIEEYEAELRNLNALYKAAQATFDAGNEEPKLARALAWVGFGDWTFDNVYSFVYDAALESDLDGSDLASVVSSTDYAASLLAVMA